MKLMQFFKELKVELARVEWPKFDEFIGATIVTLVLVLLFTVYLGVLDNVNKWVIYENIFTRIKK